ncbi:MAG: hypothetical protein A3K19_27370 [Lentisphaerae bacterium RIFOXYB12_FULL_65_16]|nr:MAG: hypothetical protein A3K18_15905 [Lentisphaerae bacterium RIFOXYA12_64_32]OGV86411.1 MAG: hypothetical protein A3K19_27370 [Lentisphaerae bacterium RIFOXYB12_FULL_65_16]
MQSAIALVPMRSFAAALTLVPFAAVTQAEPAAPALADREYVCRFTAQPPTVDGDLSDPCWPQAEPTPVLLTLGPDATPLPARMQVRFLCDDTALYVAVEAQSRPGAVPATAQPRERDSHVFSDDSVELFLHTAPAATAYFHLILNCDGAALDASHDPDAPLGQELGTKWDPEWRSATRKREGGWSAEMAIPYAAFGVTPPSRGFVWRVKVGSNAPGFPHAMWPRNPALSFHEAMAAGYLVFRDQNLLENGDFEGAVDAHGTPAGWGFSYNEKEGKGVIQLAAEGAPQGTRCIRYEKTTPEKWFPQLWARAVPFQPHSTYRLSLLVNSEKRFVLRHSLFGAAGERTRKDSTDQPPTAGFERREYTFRIDEELASLAVGLQLSQVAGVVLADDVRVERVNGAEFRRALLPEAHRYHRLEQLAARRPFKPYVPLVTDDRMQAERVIFRDTATGAWLWRLAHTPGGSTRHHYMEASPWNCDGSVVLLNSSDRGRKSNVLLAADGATAQVLPSTGWFAWDRQDRNVFYYCRRADGGKSAACRYSVETRQETVLRNFDGETSAWRISEDNKYLLIREFFKDALWAQKSKVHLLSLDGKEDLVLDPKGQIHQLWFTKLPDHSVEFEYEHGGYKPGDYPEGNFMMRKDGTITRIYGGEGLWAGHRAHSPSGRYMCPIGRLQLVDKQTGAITALGKGSGNHQTWETDDAWLAASSDPYLIRAAADGRDFVQRIAVHNSGIGHSTYWSEAHPEMSPDGTKLGYASSMLGDIEFYFAVMMLPGRPDAFAVRGAAGAVTLTWQAPKHAREIQGYLVYRSPTSGAGFDAITATPVAGCEFTDPAPLPGAAYYRVTALERCGLESLPAAEVCTDAAWPGPVRHVFEAEFAPVTQPPVMEAFDPTASGLYCMCLCEREPAAEFALPFSVPRQGTFRLWLRVKNADNAFVLTPQLDGTPLAPFSGKPGDWQWSPLGASDGHNLAAGPHTLTLAADVPWIMVDQLLITDAPGVTPTGIEGGDTTAPPSPAGLAGKALDSFTIQLEWGPVAATDFHHYNVYAAPATTCDVRQENLVASPGATAYVHWGLQAGTTYTCRVTAVDRDGNESAPSDPVAVATPPVAERVFVRDDRTWGSGATSTVDVPIECAADTDLVVWTLWQSSATEAHGTSGAFKLGIDDQAPRECTIRFGYICVGHGGPVPTDRLWNFTAPLGGEPGQERLGLRVSKGTHTLRLSVPADAAHDCHGVIVTNDFGFLPAGAYTSFLPLAPTPGATGK